MITISLRGGLWLVYFRVGRWSSPDGRNSAFLVCIYVCSIITHTNTTLGDNSVEVATSCPPVLVIQIQIQIQIQEQVHRILMMTSSDEVVTVRMFIYLRSPHHCQKDSHPIRSLLIRQHLSEVKTGRDILVNELGKEPYKVLSRKH